MEDEVKKEEEPTMEELFPDSDEEEEDKDGPTDPIGEIYAAKTALLKKQMALVEQNNARLRNRTMEIRKAIAKGQKLNRVLCKRLDEKGDKYYKKHLKLSNDTSLQKSLLDQTLNEYNPYTYANSQDCLPPAAKKKFNGNKAGPIPTELMTPEEKEEEERNKKTVSDIVDSVLSETAKLTQQQSLANTGRFTVSRPSLDNTMNQHGDLNLDPFRDSPSPQPLIHKDMIAGHGHVAKSTSNNSALASLLSDPSAHPTVGQTKEFDPNLFVEPLDDFAPRPPVQKNFIPYKVTKLLPEEVPTDVLTIDPYNPELALLPPIRQEPLQIRPSIERSRDPRLAKRKNTVLEENHNRDEAPIRPHINPQRMSITGQQSDPLSIDTNAANQISVDHIRGHDVQLEEGISVWIPNETAPQVNNEPPPPGLTYHNMRQASPPRYLGYRVERLNPSQVSRMGINQYSGDPNEEYVPQPMSRIDRSRDNFNYEPPVYEPEQNNTIDVEDYYQDETLFDEYPQDPVAIPLEQQPQIIYENPKQRCRRLKTVASTILTANFLPKKKKNDE